MEKQMINFNDSQEYLENYMEEKYAKLQGLDVLNDSVKFNSIKQEAKRLENCLCIVDSEVSQLDDTLQEVIQEKQELKSQVNFICSLLDDIILDNSKDDIKGKLQNIIDDNYIKNI